MKKSILKIGSALLCDALFMQPVCAHEKSADELAKAAQNPLANMNVRSLTSIFSRSCRFPARPGM